MIGKLAPPKNPANAGSTSSIFAVALRKKYLIIINPNKIEEPIEKFKKNLSQLNDSDEFGFYFFNII